jgi:hypothetical protein
VLTSKLFSPSHLVVVDKAPARRQAALTLGADIALAADEDVAGSLKGGSPRLAFCARRSGPKSGALGPIASRARQQHPLASAATVEEATRA